MSFAVRWEAEEDDVSDETPLREPARGNEATTARFGEEFARALNVDGTGLTAEELAAINALPAGSALLIVRRGPNTGARFLLDAELTVAGRHADAGIFLDDVTVSRRHAEFVRTPAGFEVHDMGSLNGTYYEGALTNSALLADRSEVQIGKYRFTFYASRHDVGAL